MRMQIFLINKKITVKTKKNISKQIQKYTKRNFLFRIVYLLCCIMGYLTKNICL